MVGCGGDVDSGKPSATGGLPVAYYGVMITDIPDPWNMSVPDCLSGHLSDYRGCAYPRATGFGSFGAIPIRTGEELAGALLCFFAPPSAMLPLDESALDSVARIAGICAASEALTRIPARSGPPASKAGLLN